MDTLGASNSEAIFAIRSSATPTNVLDSGARYFVNMVEAREGSTALLVIDL